MFITQPARHPGGVSMLYVVMLVMMVVTVMHRVVLCESGIRAKQQCGDRQGHRHKGLFHDFQLEC
jgi:hypothetical protein